MGSSGMLKVDLLFRSCSALKKKKLNQESGMMAKLNKKVICSLCSHRYFMCQRETRLPGKKSSNFLPEKSGSSY
jgi:hypothetical protein